MWRFPTQITLPSYVPHTSQPPCLYSRRRPCNGLPLLRSILTATGSSISAWLNSALWSPPSCSPPPEVMGPYFEQPPCFPTLSSDTSDFYPSQSQPSIPATLVGNTAPPRAQCQAFLHRGQLTRAESEFWKERMLGNLTFFKQSCYCDLQCDYLVQITAPVFSPKHTLTSMSPWPHLIWDHIWTLF